MKALSKLLNRNLRTKSAIIEEKHGLYCEKCQNTYDWYKFEGGKEFKHGCECELIEIGKKERAYNNQKKLNALFSQFEINDDLKDATVNKFEVNNEMQQYAKETAIEYINTFNTAKGKSLILQGTYGTGKTHLAYAIAKAIKQQGYSVTFMHIPHLMERIKATYNKNSTETTEELVEMLSEVDLLVLDDIGTENTPHALSKLYSIIDNRLGMNNIYTTNLMNKELNQNTDWQRINSRMQNNARRVVMIGEDYRGKEAW